MEDSILFLILQVGLYRGWAIQFCNRWISYFFISANRWGEILILASSSGLQSHPHLISPRLANILPSPLTNDDPPHEKYPLYYSAHNIGVSRGSLNIGTIFEYQGVCIQYGIW